MFGPYDEIVSLGNTCQTAYQLRRCLGIDRAHVFDWVVTSDPGVLQHIESGLHGYFGLESLVRDENGHGRDARTGTLFMHDIPTECDLAASHGKAAPRIAALVDRWHRLMASDQSVLFIRRHGWAGHPLLVADRLHQALQAAAPRLRFRLLYLTNPTMFEAVADTVGLVHRPLPEPDPPDWRGLDSAWQELLTEAVASDQTWPGLVVGPAKVVDSGVWDKP
jgi:hypothetical protein